MLRGSHTVIHDGAGEHSGGLRLIDSVSSGQLLVAGLAGALALLWAVGFVSHLWLYFPSTEDRIQEKPSDPGSTP